MDIFIGNTYCFGNNYNITVKNTEFGKISYIEEGEGETILLSHGIFGGYDQAFVSLKSLAGNEYKKIAPSRFGYPGSDLPSDTTPKNQAKAFLSLLDQLKIQKTYIIATSAGGAAGITFAIDYPEPLLNDFPMWFSTKYFGFVFKSMFASEIDNTLYETMLPNFDDYKVEKIVVPILVINAKDDPMAKYANIEKFVARTNAKTAIFENGGHLISGHGDAVSKKIREFIEETK